MQKSLFSFIVLVTLLGCKSDRPTQLCQQTNLRAISTNEYRVLNVQEYGGEDARTKIAAIELKKVKRDTFIAFWELTTAICQDNDFVAADFFYFQEYGKCLRKEKFVWTEDLLDSMTYIGTVDAIHYGADWKEKMCKKDFSSSFQF